MGGAVVLTALEQPLDVKGAILVAPAVWSRGDMPVLYRVALFLAAHVTPGLILSNSAASRVVTIYPSDNFDMLRAMARDPLVQHETRADAVFGLTNLMDEARTAPDRIASPPPILYTYGAHDQVIPAPPTNAVITMLGALAEPRRYEKGYHMLLRDLSRAQPQADIADWVLKQEPGATKARP
jgi:alpha-beta hydrolase superfamily lysophospholipase